GGRGAGVGAPRGFAGAELDGGLAGEAPEEQGAEAVDVGPPAGAGGGLGGEGEAGAAADQEGVAGFGGAAEVGQAPADEARGVAAVEVAGDKDVPGAQVAVGDAAAVGLGERGGELAAEPDGAVGFERAGAADEGVEALAGDEVAGDEGDP